jgi:CheY-like chemotaxis protein
MHNNLVLFVHDDPVLRDLYGSIAPGLQGKYEIFTATSGKEGVQLLQQRTIDVVVSDLTKPGMDGMAVLREIRALDPRLPVVLCSGYRPPSDAFPPDPYRVFASKPYDLVEVTAQALGLPRLASPDASAPDRVRASASRAAPPGSSPRA